MVYDSIREQPGLFPCYSATSDVTTSRRARTGNESLGLVATVFSLLVVMLPDLPYRSRNSALGKPIVDSNWLRDPGGQAVVLFAYRHVLRAIVGLNAARPGIIISEEASPGKNVTSNTYLLAAICDQEECCCYTS